MTARTRVGSSVRSSLRADAPRHALVEGDLLLCSGTSAANAHDGSESDVDCGRCRRRLAAAAEDDL